MVDQRATGLGRRASTGADRRAWFRSTRSTPLPRPDNLRWRSVRVDVTGLLPKLADQGSVVADRSETTVVARVTSSGPAGRRCSARDAQAR